MTDDPVDLDAHREKSAREATESRRQRLEDFHAHQADLKCRQDALETTLLAAPAETCADATARAQYLVQLFAATIEGQEPRRRELIALALEDLAWLGGRGKDTP